jgi:hypothetical protein
MYIPLSELTKGEDKAVAGAVNVSPLPFPAGLALFTTLLWVGTFQHVILGWRFSPCYFAVKYIRLN